MRLREEGDIIVVRIDLPDRSRRLAAAPNVFFITEHYEPYPYVLVRLKAIKKEIWPKYCKTPGALSPACRRTSVKCFRQKSDRAGAVGA